MKVGLEHIGNKVKLTITKPGWVMFDEAEAVLFADIIKRMARQIKRDRMGKP